MSGVAEYVNIYDREEFHSAIKKRLKADNEALQSQLKEAEEKLKIAVEALENIAKTDTSEKAPDLLWLCNWRNTRKELAREALDVLQNATS